MPFFSFPSIIYICRVRVVCDVCIRKAAMMRKDMCVSLCTSPTIEIFTHFAIASLSRIKFFRLILRLLACECQMPIIHTDESESEEQRENQKAKQSPKEENQTHGWQCVKENRRKGGKLMNWYLTIYTKPTHIKWIVFLTFNSFARL